MLTSFLPYFCALALAASPAGRDSAPEASVLGETVRTWTLPIGTHRPELAVAPDGDLWVVVVAPSEQRGSRDTAKHRAWRIDARTGELSSSSLPLTSVTEPRGEPMDHRALFVGDELVIVYQAAAIGSRTAGRSTSPNTPISRPPLESQATRQSLMLARFDQEGHELLRKAMVADVTDFEKDSFPDFALAWHQGYLYVASGSQKPELHLRKVSLEGKVVQQATIPLANSKVASGIGTGLVSTGDELLLVASSGGPWGGDLLVATVGPDLRLSEMRSFSQGPEHASYPTGLLLAGDQFFVGHDVLNGEPGKATSYAPYLSVFDAGRRLLAGQLLESSGFNHVHPSLALWQDQIVVGWSRSVANGRVTAPQVVLQARRTSVARTEETLPAPDAESGDARDVFRRVAEGFSVRLAAFAERSRAERPRAAAVQPGAPTRHPAAGRPPARPPTWRERAAAWWRGVASNGRNAVRPASVAGSRPTSARLPTDGP